MVRNELFQLYEKLYFHEIDTREKFNARLQIPLAILVAQLSFLGYMLQNIAQGKSGLLFIAFWLLYVLSCSSTGFAIFHFVRAWYGYTYSFIPAAKETEEYHNELIELYKEYDNSEELVKSGIDQYLYDYYKECSSLNTSNNDQKSIKLHKSMSFVIGAILLSFFAFIPYHFGGIDKRIQIKINPSVTSEQASKQSETVVREKNSSILIQQTNKEDKMADKEKKPPPPPPPPPKRMIKEGVKIITPAQKSGKPENQKEGGQNG